jgi:hypothetical protein
MVGAWVGQTLRQDRPIHAQRRANLPLLAAVETRLDVAYGLEGRVPCSPEETERRCVELSYQGTIAPDDRAATLGRLRAVMPPGSSEPVPEDVRAWLSVTLVAEPDTLVPHRLVSRERLRTRLRLPDGRVREVEDHAEDEYVFTSRAGVGM